MRYPNRCLWLTMDWLLTIFPQLKYKGACTKYPRWGMNFSINLIMLRYACGVKSVKKSLKFQQFFQRFNWLQLTCRTALSCQLHSSFDLQLIICFTTALYCIQFHLLLTFACIWSCYKSCGCSWWFWLGKVVLPTTLTEDTIY